MKRIGPALAALAAFLAATPVFAADMAPAPGYYPPPVAMRPALYDWTGLYFGGHVGGGIGNDTFTPTTTTALFNAGASTGVRPFGVIGGAQLGANVEFAPWVVGIESAFTSSALTSSKTANTLATAAPVNTQRANSNPQWFVTATARFGYAANTLLFYVKGGAAWMHAEYTEESLVGGGVTASQKLNDTRSGFTAGAGLEYGMTENLSAKLEYDFYDFGTANYTFSLADPVPGPGTVTMPVSIKSTVNVIMVGLNYRLNWVGGWH